MTDISKKNCAGPKIWRLALPDWGHLDTVFQRKQPFALWTVGEQALLFHWLDAAVDQGSEEVLLFVSDRPMDVRQKVADASLWPIQIKVQSVRSIDTAQVDDVINRLPNSPPLETPPASGWDLALHWHTIEQAWLHTFEAETREFGDDVAIGKNCEIADDVQFSKPYWIGNFVSIGPGSVIGPGAVIEDGCIIAGNNRIQTAHVGAFTYLAPETDLIEAALHQNNLWNFKHRAQVHGLETFLAGGVRPKDQNLFEKPSIRDRWIALRLYLRWIKCGYSSETTFTDTLGIQRPLLKNNAVRARGPWLKEVVSGKLSLFGVTPRPIQSIEQLPEEWQSILKSAPQGAFSYADVMGVHEVGSEEEALHCIYQASDSSKHCRQLFDNWLSELK
ncbi:MAG: hypothetical protein ACJAT5_000454 [Lentimonas sp.]|jgi:hypothetical protein